MYRWSLSHPPIPILSIESKLVTMATQAPETFVFFFFFNISYFETPIKTIFLYGTGL